VSTTQQENEVLTLIQAGFPIERHPYEAIGLSCGMSADAAFSCVEGLRAAGSIRRIGAVFNSAALGYVSTLCALAVADPAAVDAAAAVVSSYPEVTHNYERVDRYNIWFTLIAADQARIAQILDEIATRTGSTDILNLPALRLYKIRVDFDLTGMRAPQEDRMLLPSLDATAATPLTEAERALVRIVQEDIGGQRDPFEQIAARLSAEGFASTPDEVVDTLEGWRSAGVIRRFGAVVRHRALGITSNAMTVWDIPDEQADEAGALMATDARVSHCYRRPRQNDWMSNLYAMVHGTSDAGCEACAAELSRRLEEAHIVAGAPRQLYSTREFKKRSMRYFREER
jgi:siroheme decarboxylase